MRVAYLLLLLGLAGFALTTLVQPATASSERLGILFNTAVVVGCAGLVVARAALVSAERRAWGLLGASVVCFAFGDVSYPFTEELASPTVSDAFYLAFYPLAYAGMVLLLSAKLRRLPVAMWLDGVIAGFALAAAASAVLFGPLVASAEGSTSATAAAVGLAYPLGDLLLLAVAVASQAALGWRPDRRRSLLAASFAVFAIADVIYLLQVANDRYVLGTTLDVLWLIALILMGVASWQPTRRLAYRRLEGWAVLITPLSCAAAAVVVLFAAVLTPVPAVASILAVLTFVTVMVRMSLTFREFFSLADSRRLALTDDLTGTANRRALFAALRARSARRAEGSATRDEVAGVSLLLVDLDRFKEINDSLGHHIGDELLRQLAVRLQRQLRAGDVLARLGGDEFAVLLDDGVEVGSDLVTARRLVETLDEPFALDDVTLHIEASVGVARYPDHCDDPMLLVRRADVAMYAAKLSRTHIAAYRSEDDPGTKATLQTLEALRNAMGQGELRCYYQPKVDLADGRVSSIEALVRWDHPTRGLLTPDDFLPLAERSGIMRPLTTIVLREALAQTRTWREQGLPLQVAVNLSVSSLLDVDLPVEIGRLLVANGLPPSALTLEITESVLMADSIRARAVVDALHDLGVGLAIDDYGTGYSSLSYLQDLPLDELKVDKIFIERLTTDPRSAAIVRSTIELAHHLELRVVAEGVEDAATNDLLASFRCDAAQGYHHSPPLPAADLSTWLRTRSVEPPGARTSLRLVAGTRPGEHLR